LPLPRALRNPTTEKDKLLEKFEERENKYFNRKTG
jgi:hypothetical protein